MRSKKTKEKEEKILDVEKEEKDVEMPADTVGSILKKERVRQKREIRRIADKLCIRASYLEALENDDFSDFPGDVYTYGFLKNYAQFLGLDAQPLIDMYRAQTEKKDGEKENLTISYTPSYVPSMRYLFAGLGLILCFFLGWCMVSEDEKEQAPLPETIEQVVAVVEEPKVDVLPVVEVAEPQIKPVAEEKKATIQIVALDDVWLEIREDDMFHFNGTLKKGNTYDVPENSQYMTLKTGNAGNTEIYVNGEKIKPLGKKGAVKGGISLDPERLKNR